MKKCPFCAEDVQDAALKCKHCGERLDGGLVAKPATPVASTTPIPSSTRAPEPTEHTLVDIPGARVTTARAIFGPRTYATAHITMATAMPKSATGDWALAILLGGGTVLLGLIDFVMVAEGMVPRAAALGFVVVTLAMAVGTVFLVFRARIEARKVAVVIESSSGRATALVTPDREQANQVVAALHEAMSAKR